MNKFYVLLISSLALSVIINAAAINYSLKIKNEKNAAEEKANNMTSLVNSVKSKYESQIQSIEEEHKIKINDLNNKIDEYQHSVIIYQNSTNTFGNIGNENQNNLSYLEQLKENNPEEYKNVMEERRNRYNDIKYTLAERTQIFLNMDTSYMNPEEQENHQQLVSKMGEIFELSQLFKDPSEGSNRDVWRQMGPLIQEMRPMLNNERKAIFKKTFTDKFGLSTDESSEFTDYIEHLIDATSFQPGRRRNITNN